MDLQHNPSKPQTPLCLLLCLFDMPYKSLQAQLGIFEKASPASCRVQGLASLGKGHQIGIYFGIWGSGFRFSRDWRRESLFMGFSTPTFLPAAILLTSSMVRMVGGLLNEVVPRQFCPWLVYSSFHRSSPGIELE